MRARSQHGQGQSTTSDPAGTRNSSPSTCNRRLGSSFAMLRSLETPCQLPVTGGQSATAYARAPPEGGRPCNKHSGPEARPPEARGCTTWGFLHALGFCTRLELKQPAQASRRAMRSR